MVCHRVYSRLSKQRSIVNGKIILDDWRCDVLQLFFKGLSVLQMTLHAKMANPLFQISKKCVNNFCREPTNDIKQLKKTLLSNLNLIRQRF